MKNGKTNLWTAVCTTNPANTRQVNHRGGFTAICAQSQLKAATEMFGMYGVGWGINFESDEYVRDSSGNIVEYVYKGTFWFKYAGEEGVFPCQSSIKYRAGDDVQMKAETHARSKALSKLGFNSDVYQGEFDDNKFVRTNGQLSNGVNRNINNDKAIGKSRILRDLASVCFDRGVDKAQKKTLVDGWVKKYGVDSFGDLSVTQITECINEIKKMKKESGEQQ
jgi:hypothetical protein